MGNRFVVTSDGKLRVTKGGGLAVCSDNGVYPVSCYEITYDLELIEMYANSGDLDVTRNVLATASGTVRLCASLDYQQLVQAASSVTLQIPFQSDGGPVSMVGYDLGPVCLFVAVNGSSTSAGISFAIGGVTCEGYPGIPTPAYYISGGSATPTGASDDCVKAAAAERVLSGFYAEENPIIQAQLTESRRTTFSQSSSGGVTTTTVSVSYDFSLYLPVGNASQNQYVNQPVTYSQGSWTVKAFCNPHDCDDVCCTTEEHCVGQGCIDCYGPASSGSSGSSSGGGSSSGSGSGSTSGSGGSSSGSGSGGGGGSGSGGTGSGSGSTSGSGSGSGGSTGSGGGGSGASGSPGTPTEPCSPLYVTFGGGISTGGGTSLSGTWAFTYQTERGEGWDSPDGLFLDSEDAQASVQYGVDSNTGTEYPGDWVFSLSDDASFTYTFTTPKVGSELNPSDAATWTLAYTDQTTGTPTLTTSCSAPTACGSCVTCCFQAGTSYSFTAPCNGTLTLYYNDVAGEYGNNTGSFAVVVNGTSNTLAGTDSDGIAIGVISGTTYTVTASGSISNGGTGDDDFTTGPNGTTVTDIPSDTLQCPSAAYGSLAASFFPEESP